MPFDPSLPFEEVDETDTLSFDTVSKPKTTGFDFNQPFEEVEDTEDQAQFDADYFRPKPLKTEKKKREIGTLEGISNAAKNAFDSSRQAMDVVGGVSPEEAQNIAKIEFDKKSRKLAPGYDEYQKAEGMDAVWAFAKNPIEVTSNIIAEGLTGSLPALGAGLAAGGVGAAAGSVVPGIGTAAGFTAGQVAGTFAGSLATEYGGKVLEELQGEGMDISDPNSIQTFFGNEELLGRAKDKALKRGVPIAAFDAISAGIGGKLGRVFGTKAIEEGGKIIGKQFATKTGEALTELGVQAGLGGGGEIAGSLVAGEPIEGKAVFGEVIGEVGPGSVEVLTGRIADQRAMAKTREEAKIKATSELSTKLEDNNAPLTASVVTAKSAVNIEQDKLAAQLDEELTIQETAAAAAQQQKQTDATQKIIQPEGVRQEPQDGTQIRQTTEAGVSDSLLGAEGIQEEGQVDSTIFDLQSVANNTATREQISALSLSGLVDIRRGQAIINEDGEGILAQAQAQLPKLTPEERAAEVEATPRPLPTDALPTETPGATYGREAELFDVFGGVRRRPVDVTEPTIGGIPQTSPMVGEQPTQPIISEIPKTSELVGEQQVEPIISEKLETSDIVGTEPATIVEQEQVAPVESAIDVARKTNFAAAATREEAGDIGRNLASQDPSLPPLPPQQFEVLESISNFQKRKGYNPDALSGDLLNEARNSGFITGKQIGKIKLTEAGSNQLREWSDQARERSLAESALSDEISDIAVSQWDAANDPSSAAAMAARTAPAITPTPAEAFSTPAAISKERVGEKESSTTTELREKIKEAKGKDRQIVFMKAMADGSFFPSAIEAAELGKPFPSIGDTKVDDKLPDSIPQTIDVSKIKLQPIKTKLPEVAVSPMISYDDDRFMLWGVYFDSTNNMVVATDGRALVAIPKKITGGDKIVAERNIKKQGIKKGDLIEGNYPNWKAVVPTYGKDIQKVDIDIDDALKASTILDSINNTFNNKVGSSLIVFNGAKLDPKYVLSSITALVESGAKSITAQTGSEAGPVLLTGDNGSIAVIMPKRVNERISHPLKSKVETKPEVKKYNTEALLNAAKPFSEFGSNYNRNIAASYERLKGSIEKGSLESTIAYNAKELQIRLNKFEPEALANAMQEQVAPTSEPAGISVGNRIKLGKSPQTYIVEEAIPQTEVEKANNEQFYSVKNERTGEVQVVEKADMKQVGGKRARKMAAQIEGQAIVDADMGSRTQSELTPQEIDQLEKGRKIRVFRAMQIIDGKLYPPMSALVGGKLRKPTEIGAWEKAEERPDLLDKKGKFILQKGNKATVPAAYNPYFHTSSSPLNDQFSSAYKRDNLVTVEVEIPASELTSGYKAEGAKDAVGEVSWNAGPVSSKLPEGKKRKVFLSRYAKVVRIVPDSEVARIISNLLQGTNLSIPENTVTPSLKSELEKKGVIVTPKPADIRRIVVEEKISKTALIDKDGSVISAPNKNHAMLMEESQFNLDAGEYPPMENYGFVTNFGRFVGQKEAQEIARNSQQVVGNQPISGEIVTAINEDEAGDILKLNVQGASGNKFNEANFTRFPGKAVTRTNSETLTSHPLYNAAKRFNNVEAAKIIVDEFVDDQMVFDVFAGIDQNKPAYIVPVLKGEADSMNMIPVALAEKLSSASGIPVWGNLIQATSEQSTGAGVNEKTEISRQFMGEAPPAGAQIIIVDDYLATGRTIASLENMTGTASAVATIAFGRYGNQYGLTTERADKMLQKANVTRDKFYEIYGKQPEQAITGIEAQAYILNGAAGESGFASRFPIEKISPSNEGIKNIANVPESVVLFAGGGLTELGLVGIVRNGYVVEANQRIAEFYEEAHGVPVIQDYVQNVKFYGINGGHFHASPVCKNFSGAKNKKQITQADIELDETAANAVAQAITDIQPNTISIENVKQYKGSDSYNTIISALEKNGYIYDANVYKSSDFGAPTSRERLIIRAVKKGGVLPEIKTRNKRVSWYDSVKDIVNDLPDHDIYERRYPAKMMQALERKGIDLFNVREPLLISGMSGESMRWSNEPAFTLLASPGSLNIIALPGGVIKKVTARAMARMTGVPDSFPLPADEALAKTIIGNGIPPALTRSVIGDLIIKNQKPDVVTPEAVPQKNQYTYEEAVKEVDAHFGKQGIPEGIVIVNNTTEPDLEMKAGYFVNRGQIVINLAYIAKGENLGDIIDHELGHYIFGDPEFQADFKEFWDMMTPEEKAKADQIISQFYNKETGAVQMEEKQIRAFMQLIQDSKAMPKWKQLLDKIKRWINEKLGTNLLVTDRNALAVLAAAHKRFKSGEQIIREIDSGVLKSAETAQDADYLAAVERVDMETAQRMVDEAAKPPTHTLIDASKTQSDKIRWTDSANSQIEFYKSQIAKLPSVEEATREYEALVKAWNDAGLGQSVEDTIKGIIELKLQPPPSSLDEYLQTRIYLERKNAEAEIKKSQETLSRAPKGKTETEFKTGQPTVVKAYHSTPFGRLTEFSDEMLGRFTGAPSATKAHFFAGSPSVSETYFADDAWLLNHKGFFSLSAEQKKQLIESAREELPNGLDSTPDEIADLAMSLFDIDTYDTSPYENVRHDVYIRLNNPLVYDFKGAGYRDVSYNDLLVQAAEGGHDGVIMANTTDPGPASTLGSFPEPANIIAVLRGHSSKIKSADPVTFDDAGNVIPLSQRFQLSEPDIRRMAAEPKREQVASKKRGDIITTPEGIIKQTNEVLRNKFFDGSEVSDENTSAAWDYIEQLLDIDSGAANALAGQINDIVDQDTNSDSRMGASLFSVSLANYAAKLQAQGDNTMISYLIRRINRMPIDNLAGGTSDIARALRARREYEIDGYKVLQTEHESKVERTTAALFGTGKPSEEQVDAVDAAIKASEDTSIGEPEEVASEIEKVEKRTGRKVVKKIEDKIKESTEPKKEELLISFQNLNADKKIKGIKLTYSPNKVNPSKNIKDFIVGKLVEYRKTLVNQGASGLESTFWQTMSDQERKPGPLGEIDQAQNNELAKIVQKTLIDLGLKGEPPNTKMTDIEKVASILNKQKLSEEKRIEADQRIVAEIERRREGELAAGFDEESVNAKYDIILDAWNQSMSRQLNMPVSDNMLQRLISSELKEQKKKISELIDEPDGKVTAETKRNIVDSIIRKIYGVSKEFETGIEMDENYDGLKGYLEQTIDNMYARQIEKKNAAYAKRQAKISLRNNVEGQAQGIIDQLANQLSDTPAFPQKEENQIKAIVQQDLRQRPDMKRKQPWTSQLTAKLIQAGASEAQALTISDLVWRQHEIKAMDRELKELQTAAEKGSLAVIIQRIKDTPLEEQQKPEWMQSVIRDYLVEAGLSSQAADTAARLYESVIAERFAEAKQKAFEATLAKSAPWQNYLSRNAQLGKNALKKIQDAIRTGVLDPTQTTEGIIAKENGWSGFSKEQLTRIVQLDGILSDDANNQIDKAEAMSELNKIIVKAKMPVRFKDAIGAYYVAQALMGIPTLLVNIVSPVGFSVRNMITDIGRYAFTEPSRIPMAFETFLDSMKSWYNQTSYAFKNQIYMNDVVEYLQGQNVLRELFDKGKSQWAKGDYANGMANMLVGMTQITGRVLSSLDQGAISALENQNITRYAMEAMKQNNIPQNKRKEFANMILHMRRQTYMENVSSGMAGDRAGVLADLAVRNEIVTGLSEVGVRDKVLDSAINDALQTVGRNKTIGTDRLTGTTKKLSDEGILSYLPISFLENIASGAAKQGPAMQVFSKMLYGFALVPARVFHTTAWYSPYGFVRLAVDKYKKNKGEDSPYAMSLQTEIQYKQRLTETIAGSVVMLGFAALAGSSTDDDDEEKFKIVITGNGPSYSADKQYFDAWHKKYKPYSINIVMGNTIIPINIGRGGEALFFPIMLAGALDDWKIKEKLNLAKKEPKELNLAVEALGSAFFALAQRGPYAAFTKPLFDASKDGKITEELVGQAGFFGKTFIPIIGSSLSRNISDFINDPVERSSLQGAIYANTPIVGPWLGTKALNALGQPIRADDWGDKLFKLGVPVVFSFPKNTPENELNELILKKGSGPSIPTRSNAQKRFGDVLTDKEFEIYVREYGRVVSDKMFKNRKKLENMSVKNYDDELEGYVRGYSVGDTKITGAADMAVRAVRRSRNE